MRLRTPSYDHNSRIVETRAGGNGKRQCSATLVEKMDDAGDVSKERKMGRRNVLELAALTVMVGNAAMGASPALAYKPPPEGEVWREESKTFSGKIES